MAGSGHFLPGGKVSYEASRHYFLLVMIFFFLFFGAAGTGCALFLLFAH
jgi:hypothetical protein